MCYPFTGKIYETFLQHMFTIQIFSATRQACRHARRATPKGELHRISLSHDGTQGGRARWLMQSSLIPVEFSQYSAMTPLIFPCVPDAVPGVRHNRCPCCT